MAVEGLRHQEIAQRYGVLDSMQPARLGAGTYTDDTQMMIGLAESLIACEGYDGADMAERWVDNFEQERGYGRAMIGEILALQAGARWDEVSTVGFPQGSFGNGSAMRIAPVGCLCFDDLDALRTLAEQTSRLSHSHPYGMEGGTLQAAAVALALRRDPREPFGADEYVGEMIDFCDDERKRLSGRLAAIQRILARSPTVGEVVAALGNGITTFESVPTAIYSFVTHADSFRDAVVYAVNLGGDTDTIGAMTGAIAGAYHGVTAIPRDWYEALEVGPKGREYVVGLASSLFDLWKATGSLS